MVERADRRQPGIEKKFGESQGEKLGSVRAEQTASQSLEKPKKLELVPDPLETRLEDYRYRAGQEIELLNDQGNFEKQTVVSVNPEDDEVFLMRSGDQSVAPSLEALHRTELALEEATRPMIEAAAELWDEVIDEYASAPGALTSPEAFKRELGTHKGRILRATALEVFNNHPDILQAKNPDALRLVLDKTLSQYMLAEAERQDQRDPRHTAAERLQATADYLEAVDHVHHPELVPGGQSPAVELANSKLALLTTGPLPERAVRSLEPNARTSTMERSRQAARDAWEELRSRVKLAENKLLHEDLSSFKMAEIADSLQAAFRAAMKAETSYNEARLKAGLKGGTIASDELLQWHEIMRAWEQKPGVAEVRAAQKRDRPVVKVPTERAAPQHAPQPAPRPTRVGGFLDKIFSWFES